MWSGPSGGTMAGASVGGTLTATQMSPAFGPMSSEFGMASMPGRSPASNELQGMQMQQMSQSAMRYPQYMQGQLPSPSFVSPTGKQQPYPVDPAGARPGSYMGPQCGPTSSYVGQPGYGQVMFDAAGYSRQQPQQVMMASSSNMQMAYRCQQQFANPQQMRSYSQQQQVMQMQQQHAAGVSQQVVVDPMMYPSGIPSATQRTPGMSHAMMPSSQVRGMVVPGYNLPASVSPSGDFMRARAPAPISPAYPNGPGPYAQGQTMMIRAGTPILYSQMQSDITRQQIVAYPNPNASLRDPADPVARASPPYPVTDMQNKMAFPYEMIVSNLSLEHETNRVEYIFTVNQERFDLLRRGEMELQLKSNIRSNTNTGSISQQNIWPTMQSGPGQAREPSVMVCLNSSKAEIVDPERSLYLGYLCGVGTNKLVITSSRCVCHHLFALQWVKCGPVQMVLNDICARRQATANPTAARDKLVKIIQMDSAQSRISLRMWNSPRKIRIPARSVHCAHTACFDLEAFLARNLDNSVFACPECSINFHLEDIEIDYFLAQILSETSKAPEVGEIQINASNGCWGIVYPSMDMNQLPHPGTPHLKTPGSVPQCPTDVAQSRPMKRELESMQSALSGVSGPSLKRIKSEPFAVNGNNSNPRQQDPAAQSPFNSGSVPAPSTSWIPSPNGPLPSLSPSGPSASPPLLQSGQQPVGSSSAPSRYNGPDTPVTPGSGQNQSPVGPSVSPGGTQIQGVMNSQGSVEAVSVAGSAPYTPASVGSLNSGTHGGIPASSIASSVDTSFCLGTANTSISEITCSLNASAIDDALMFEDLLNSDVKMSSASEMEKYLREDVLANIEMLDMKATAKNEGELPSRSLNDDQDWLDFAQVIARES